MWTPSNNDRPGYALAPEFCPRCLARGRRHVTFAQPPAPGTGITEDRATEVRQAILRVHSAMRARTESARERTDAQITRSRDRLERARVLLNATLNRKPIARSIKQPHAYPNGLAIQRHEHGTVVRITIHGELDLATAPHLRDSYARERAGDSGLIVLDLSGVTFIDSSGLHALLDAHEQFNGRLRIIASEPCLRMATIAGIADRLPLVGSEPSGGTPVPGPPERA
jgi:anti-anti-sigma factor